MTYADATIDALAVIAYAYAVELNEAAIHADHDELEQLARQITDKLKAGLRVALAADAAVLSLEHLHDLLYTAQRTTGEAQAVAIGQARLVLSNLRAARTEAKEGGAA